MVKQAEKKTKKKTVKRFNEKKANAWFAKHPNYFIWTMNPAFCDYVDLPEGEEAEAILDADYKARLQAAKPGEIVERFDSVKELWASEDKAKLDNWASTRNRVIRLFNPDKADCWLKNNPGGIMNYDNPYFYDYYDKSQWTENNIEEKLDKVNHEEFLTWRANREHYADNVKLINGEEVSIFDTVSDPAAEFEVSENVYAKVKVAFAKKPEWENVVVNIVFKDMSVKEYAEKVGKDPSGIGKMRDRALSKLRKFFE